MDCCHYFQPTEGGDTAFTVDVSMVTFGRGCLREAGDRARALGIERAALMTDRQVGQLEYVATVRHSLEAAGVDVALYDEVRIEPTDTSFQDAARFARAAGVDGFGETDIPALIDGAHAQRRLMENAPREIGKNELGLIYEDALSYW